MLVNVSEMSWLLDEETEHEADFNLVYLFITDENSGEDVAFMEKRRFLGGCLKISFSSKFLA